MISTSSHNNCNTNKFKTMSISGNRGKDANYVGEYFASLAPKRDFWYIWHNNIGKIDELENNKYYIEQYYETVLSKLDPKETYEKLDGTILLCYENYDEFCHRHIVAAWFELFLDVTIPEVKIIDDKMEFKTKPDYIKDMLDEVIKVRVDMKGFNSLKELYSSSKGKSYTLKKHNN